MDKKLKSVLLVVLGIAVLVSGSMSLVLAAELYQVAPTGPVGMLMFRCFMTGLYFGGGTLMLAGWEPEE